LLERLPYRTGFRGGSRRLRLRALKLRRHLLRGLFVLLADAAQARNLFFLVPSISARVRQLLLPGREVGLVLRDLALHAVLRILSLEEHLLDLHLLLLHLCASLLERLPYRAGVRGGSRRLRLRTLELRRQLLRGIFVLLADTAHARNLFFHVLRFPAPVRQLLLVGRELGLVLVRLVLHVLECFGFLKQRLLQFRRERTVGLQQ